jgi:hypothetical protein
MKGGKFIQEYLREMETRKKEDERKWRDEEENQIRLEERERKRKEELERMAKVWNSNNLFLPIID